MPEKCHCEDPSKLMLCTARITVDALDIEDESVLDRIVSFGLSEFSWSAVSGITSCSVMQTLANELSAYDKHVLISLVTEAAMRRIWVAFPTNRTALVEIEMVPIEKEGSGD